MTLVDATATATLGGISGTLAYGPSLVDGTATATLGGIVAEFYDSDDPSIAIYEADADTWVAAVPLADGIQWMVEVSAPGSVSCRMPLTYTDDATGLEVPDPVTAEATPGRILKVFWRGAARQAAKIGGYRVAAAVDGRMWREFANLPGMLDTTRDAVVWPEYGTGRAYSTTRTFGYMSLYGAYWSIGNWEHPASVVQYQDDTGFRAGKPAGLAYPNPWWIARTDPYDNVAPGSSQWFRHYFTTTAAEIDYQILATGDDHLEGWLDGEQIITPDMQQGQTWKQLVQVTGQMQKGDHVLAFRVRNSQIRSNPLALIVALQQLQKNGDVVPGYPIAKTSSWWNVSDVMPGFRRADVIRRNVFEARERDVQALINLRLDFDIDYDSAGVPWTDDPDQYQFEVGTPLLDMIQQLCEGDSIDVWVNPTHGTLQCFTRLGTDRSGTVSLALGDGDTGMLLQDDIDTAAPGPNTALMQLADGTFTERQDATAAGAHGRIETAVSLGNTATRSGANKVADGQFAQTAQPVDTFTISLTSLDGPQPYRDFYLGDSVNVERDDGTTAKVRVMAMTFDASQDTPIQITPEVLVEP